ncbi:signal peptide peptidase SppA [Fervidibacillus halotolerans]|uniref:Signal peptide peptidase SppA n=1 Tax=Fervidibacillus halotolerans TaxID=2980027 RepID=A0A9E8LY38_9BACI|nr:signal peptide peptidase SppA [Fervidibacillus halotolerans]WAA11689.1 signal peptide peptidase SppA [Fervidibacillus halotolerans]
MNAKRWIALGIAVLMFFISVVTSVTTFFTIGDGRKALEEWLSADEEFSEEVIEEGDLTKKIVVLEVNGTIQDGGSSLLTYVDYNHQLFLEQLKTAKEDSTVKGIVLRVNTPGGGVVESAEIHDRLTEILEDTEKPIYVSMGTMAASGGYYISAPATKIFASKETITGSIGVIMQSYNMTELADKLGVDTITIKSGQYKDILNPTREMTEEEKKILQEMIDNTYEEFVKVIADGRNMSEEEVKKIADGRIYDGRQAKELNLIDEFGFLDDTIEAMKNDYNLKNAQVVRYVANDLGIGSILGLTMNKMLGNNPELTIVNQLLNHHHSPRLMYLYSE